MFEDNSITNTAGFLNLPDCILEQILGYLPCDEIAKMRLVCSRFNYICQNLLNLASFKMTKRHAQLHKIFKAKMPRRESERRNHPLSKHSDILTCIETRLSMLSMTYNKYIDACLCCFIPGKVIDEVNRILNIISRTDLNNADELSRYREHPLRTHEILQELRDISSMAIDHFEEKIASELKKAYCSLPSRTDFSGALVTYSSFVKNYQSTSTSVASPSPPAQPNIRSFDPDKADYIKLERKFKIAMRKLNNVIGIQNRQAQKLRNCSIQINELNAQVIDLRRRLEEANNSKTTMNPSEVDEPPRRTTRASSIILKRVGESSGDSIPSTKKRKQ